MFNQPRFHRKLAGRSSVPHPRKGVDGRSGILGPGVSKLVWTQVLWLWSARQAHAVQKDAYVHSSGSIDNWVYSRITFSVAESLSSAF